jgi:D-isomer specific 2-hydroxyacid dehydrogenase, NAD binding domain
MIDRAAIAALKPGAVLVNIARGQVIDEQAMIDALRTGHIAFAALEHRNDRERQNHGHFLSQSEMLPRRAHVRDDEHVRPFAVLLNELQPEGESASAAARSGRQGIIGRHRHGSGSGPGLRRFHRRVQTSTSAFGLTITWW